MDFEKSKPKVLISTRVEEDIKRGIDKIAQEHGVYAGNVTEQFITAGYARYMKSKGAKVKPVENKVVDGCKDALDHLNTVTGRRFSASDDVKARLKEYTLKEVKQVIDYKAREWMGTDMQKYLRPETLFRKKKFEGYLNDAKQQVKTNGNASSNDLAEQARQLASQEDGYGPICSNEGLVQQSMDIEHNGKR